MGTVIVQEQGGLQMELNEDLHVAAFISLGPMISQVVWMRLP